MKTVKGTRDLLPEDTALFQHIEQTALSHFTRYGFHEIRTPIFEETKLFTRGIGDETDIVAKEMYSFQDKGGRAITLRPEMTASVCRAVLQHNMVSSDDILRLMYSGPMFRNERPQAGRYRQFYQFGVEVFGSDDPLIDIETIQALMAFLKPFELPNLALVINSVGDQSDRPKYLAYLTEALSRRRTQLCADCQTRLDHNVLRVLDCKNPNCQAQLDDLKPISEFWSAENRRHFDAVREGLTKLAIPFTVNHKLVRGLDYYTRTAFELVSGDLGAQSAVMGGGRYDRLTQIIGGRAIPAFGWALGIDRLAQLLSKTSAIGPAVPDIFFVFSQRAWLDDALGWIADLREQGVSVAYDLRAGSFKSQMKRANRQAARFAGIIGEDEHVAGTVTLKDMASSEQETLRRGEIAARLQEEPSC